MLFCTTDGGSNWTEHSLPEFKSRFRNYTSYRSISLSDVGEIYIAGGNGTIIKSDDLGQSWSILSGILNEMFSVQFLDSINGFLATSNGYIYKTNDGGQSWTTPANSPTTRDVLNLNFINNHTGFATTDNEILKTTNGGASWIKETYTPNHQYLTLNDIFFVDSLNGWAGGTYRTIIHSNDGGVNWQVQLEDNGVVEIKSIYFFNENKGYAVAVTPGTYNWEYLIYKTTDGGNSWSADSLKIEGYFGGKIKFINENEGWLLLDDRLLYSSDAGNTWELKFNVDGEVLAQDLSVINQDKIWITTWYGVILNSTNGGETWGIQKKYNDYSHSLRSINMFNDQLGWVVGSPDIIYKTDNGGQGQINFPSIPDLLHPLDGSLVVEEGFPFEWIGATDCFSRFQISTDVEFNNILFEGYYISNSINSNWIIEFENNKKYYWRVQSENQIGTSDWSPVWYFTTDIHPVLDVKKDSKINQFRLQQNYPNPFNPLTKIKYEIPAIGNVAIKVFDILGREILTLVNEIKPAGEYEIQFDGGSLSSGIYFYQIKAGTFVETKKMILLK